LGEFCCMPLVSHVFSSSHSMMTHCGPAASGTASADQPRLYVAIEHH